MNSAPSEADVKNAVEILKASLAASDAATPASRRTVTSMLRGLAARAGMAAEVDEYGSEKMGMEEEDQEKIGGMRRSRRAMEEDEEKIGGRRRHAAEDDEEERKDGAEEDEEKESLRAQIYQLQAAVHFSQAQDMVNEMAEMRSLAGASDEEVQAFADSLYGLSVGQIQARYAEDAPLIAALRASASDPMDDLAPASVANASIPQVPLQASEVPEESQALGFNGGPAPATGAAARGVGALVGSFGPRGEPAFVMEGLS